MREVWLVIGLGLLLAVFSAVGFFDPGDVVLYGRHVMIGAVILALPFECAYFAFLYFMARRRGLPKGWYWQSFDHHHLLHGGERVVMYFFFGIGSSCMVVAMLGVVVVIAAAVRAIH